MFFNVSRFECTLNLKKPIMIYSMQDYQQGRKENESEMPLPEYYSLSIQWKCGEWLDIQQSVPYHPNMLR